jgi:predicted DsbA family dithiol-disulfide isomerase
VKLGWGALPEGVGPGQLVGGAALSGIGFTVSLLIANLAFESQELQNEATVGVLIAGVLSSTLGWIIFRFAETVLGERSASLPVLLEPPVDPERDHIRGRIDAPLTLVEYADFECPFCGAVTGVVEALRERFGDELRYVFRHLPLTNIHRHAQLAALAAEAAGEQGRFWEMHDLLFQHQDQLEMEDLLGHAHTLGLDVEEFARAFGRQHLADRVEEDVESANASGARATPTFFIGGRRHVGPYDVESLAAELEASRGPATAD